MFYSHVAYADSEMISNITLFRSGSIVLTFDNSFRQTLIDLSNTAFFSVFIIWYTGDIMFIACVHSRTAVKC